jgi:hypothetical protein
MTTNKSLNTQTSITEITQHMVDNMEQNKNQPEKLDRLFEAGSNPARSTSNSAL